MSSYEYRQRMATQPTSEFLATIDPADLKDLGQKAVDAANEHRLMTTAVHWLVQYGDLLSAKLADRMAYETQAVAIARKLDSDPQRAEEIIARYEEREIVRGQYG